MLDIQIPMASKTRLETFYVKEEDDDEDPIDMLRSSKPSTQIPRRKHLSSAIRDVEDVEDGKAKLLIKLKRFRTTSLLDDSEETLEQPRKKIKAQRVCHVLPLSLW